MTVYELIEHRRVINASIDKLSDILVGTSIFIRHRSELHIEPSNHRLHALLKIALQTELDLLLEESLGINLKIDAINTLLTPGK